MRIIDFRGILPKYNKRKLASSVAIRAVDVDLYGGRLVGLPSPVDKGYAVAVDGSRAAFAPKSLHIAGNIVVAFEYHTFVAPDPLNRLGANSFLFVQDGTLFRTSPSRIMAHKQPLPVAIPTPTAAPTAAVLPNQGCKVEPPAPACDGDDTTSCYGKNEPPLATAYRFTYVNACGDESAPSPASNIVDVKNGDGVALNDASPLPDNVVARRWYRTIVTSKGEALWLFVEQVSTAQSGYIDGKCDFELGEQLITEHHFPPPTCIKGVAPFGDNTTLVWTNRFIYVSQPNLPHAYDDADKYEVRFDIVGIQAFTAGVEDTVTYHALVATTGMPYNIAGKDNQAFAIQEVQDWQPCSSAASLCEGEGLAYYTSPHGIVAFSGGNAKVITSGYATEIEWEKYKPNTQRLCFWSGRLWAFYDGGGLQIRTSNSDVDREEQLTELSGEYTTAAATADFGMYVTTKTGAMYRWCANTQDRLPYLWKARLETQAGLWYPVSLKVEAERDTSVPAPAKLVREYKEHVRVFGCGDTFFDGRPETLKYIRSLTKQDKALCVDVGTDNGSVFSRRVAHNRPFRLPRIKRALYWYVTVSGTAEVYEIHMQTSNEDLVQEGGAV